MTIDRDHHGRAVENDSITFSKEFPGQVSLHKCTVSVHPDGAMHVYCFCSDPEAVFKATAAICRAFHVSPDWKGSFTGIGHGYSVTLREPRITFNIGCDCKACTACKAEIAARKAAET